MVSREYAAKLEMAVLISWLMKDFSWVLMLAPICWTAALSAIVFQFHSIALEWNTSSNGVNVHSVAGLLWIVGNAIWMTSELLWDPETSYDRVSKRSIFPWHDGPLAGQSIPAYTTGLQIAQCVFISALVMQLIFYVVSAIGLRSSESTAGGSTNPQDDDTEENVRQPEPLVFGCMTQQVYMMIYIGPWILKDFFWTLELLYPALVCSVIVFSLMVDNYRRFGSPVSPVEMFWVCANTIWIISELGTKRPLLWPRVVAGGFLLIGCVLTMRIYQKAASDLGDSRILSSKATEETALIGRASASSS